MSTAKIVSLAALLLVSQISWAQKGVEKLEKWGRAGRWGKIARKAPEVAREFPGDHRVYYLAALAEMEIAKEKKRGKKGHKHLLSSVIYYDLYREYIPGGKPDKTLSGELYTIINEYRDYWTAEGNDDSAGALEAVLAASFQETQPPRPADNTPAPAGATEPRPSADRKAILAEAAKHLGKPYAYGASGPVSFDCSGFTQYVFKKGAGREIPRASVAQSQAGKSVSDAKAREGDLIFFRDPGEKKVNHVAIVYSVSGGKIKSVIHSTSRGVVIDDTDKASWNSYWKQRKVGVRNLLD